MAYDMKYFKKLFIRCTIFQHNLFLMKNFYVNKMDT